MTTNDNIHKFVLFLIATLVATACSKDDASTSQPPSSDNSVIQLNADVWRVMEGTRAATYDNQTAIRNEGTFTCTVYNEGTITEYISSSTVTWNGSTAWEFPTKHYWPMSGSLDFFAYMPATPPSYITSPTYTAAHNVTFTCSSLPMTNSGQGSGLKEFIYGIALGQNKGNASSGVPLTFQHPFARIKLQLAASHPNVTINSITFRSIKNNGSYDQSASPKWSTSGDATNFVFSLTGDAAVFNNNPATATQIGEYYIMIPQVWAGEIVVNADCLFWGDKVNYPSLTTTVPTTWQPGYSYTYTFNISPDDLKVDIENTFTEQW